MDIFDVDLDSLPEEINPEEIVLKSKYHKISKHEEEKLDKQKDEKLVLDYEEKSYKLISNANEIFSLPKKGQIIKLITKRSFNVIAFIKYIIEKESIDQLIIVVYSIDYKSLKLIERYMNDGSINNMTFLISNLRLNEGDKKSIFLKTLSESYDNFNMLYAYSHCKIISCYTNSGNYYSIEGSGNFSHNARIEQYSLENEKRTFDFHKKWISEIDQFSTDKDISRL